MKVHLYRKLVSRDPGSAAGRGAIVLGTRRCARGRRANCWRAAANS